MRSFVSRPLTLAALPPPPRCVEEEFRKMSCFIGMVLGDLGASAWGRNHYRACMRCLRRGFGGSAGGRGGGRIRPNPDLPSDVD
ncbi:hypothetical protein BaRGS_00016745 [Batillaria attramentaria]|uniref:Uncharacterized protein n=1 Tax=Batillaria attramentaria TaxID=370345 RepID=A0ABD0KYL3_9CAEN